MSISNYIKNEIYRKVRYIKRRSIAMSNIKAHGVNEAELLSYKENGYYPITPINEYQNENAFYGISKVFREYGDYDGVIRANIEHGVYLGDSTAEIVKYDMPAVITFSLQRLEAIRKVSKKPVFAVGPYILYAKKILSESEFIKLKNSLGKTLLVMPSHGLELMGVKYSINDFINFIKRVKKDYNYKTVLVCLYFADIADYASKYEKEGFKVVCCGHRTDDSFLARQRMYMELSDMLITNGVGTHIGYAVSLNIPVSYYDQNVAYEFESNSIINDVAPSYGSSQLINSQNEIINAFRGVNTDINDYQYEVVNKYWGLNNFKSKEDFKRILSACEIVWKRSAYSAKGFEELFFELKNRTF